MAENSINIVKQNGSSENVSIDYEAWTLMNLLKIY